jgi:hypothetical protein
MKSKLFRRSPFFNGLRRAAAGGVALSLGISLTAQGNGLPTPDSACRVPYTATQWSTSKTTLPSGKVVVMTNQVDFAQSSTGQLLMIAHRGLPTEERKAGQPIMRIMVMDKQKGTFTVLFPATHIATTVHMPTNQAADSTPLPASTKTDLGSKKIEGITAVGERNVYTTMEPGKELNSSLHEVTRTTEHWYNQKMCLTLKSETQDSEHDSGLTVMTDVKRVEPPASLFEIPDGYTMSKP